MKRIVTFFIILSCLVMNVARSQDTLVLQPGPEGKDAIITTNYSEPFGNYPNMFAMAGTHNGEPFVCRSLIEFDLSSLPADAYVIDARLSFYFANNPANPHTHFGDNGGFLQRVITPWEEDSVTWFNQPETTIENMVRIPASESDTQDYVGMDVTVLIRDILNDPENSFGILFRLQVEEMYRRLMFASGDYEDPLKFPKLEIVYIICEPPVVDFEYEVSSHTVNFTGISPTADTWHWDFGDGDTSDLQNPVHVYEQPGIYEACLRVEDDCYFAEQCEAFDICDMPPVAGFTYNTDGLEVAFQDTSLIATGFYWDFGDGESSTEANPSHIYFEPGYYEVCLVAFNSCGSDTTCEVVDLCVPVAGFTYFNYDLSVYFENDSYQADQYYWDFGDGYYSSLRDPWHMYDYPGYYIVCLTTWNSCGSDDYCEIIDLSLQAMPETETGSIVLYPNPARNEVFFKTIENGLANVSLTDLSGKQVLKMQMEVAEDQAIRIPLAQVKPGIYIFRFTTGRSEAYKKLVIMN
jgi:PKD repeat protein